MDKTGDEANEKTSILFVGGFSIPKDGTEGGQIFACRSLVGSPLSSQIDWKLIDSTQRSNPIPNIVVRGYYAIRRVLKSLYYLSFTKVDSVLVFSSLSATSILEKGIICLLGRLFGKRVVLSPRTDIWPPTILRRLYFAYLNMSIRACDVVLCQSDFLANRLQEVLNIPSDRLNVIPNWIDSDRFRPDRDIQAEEPDPETFELVYIGWLDPIKGIEFLIEAISLLRERRTNFILSLYGGGVSERDLKALSKSLGVSDHVIFRGWIPNEHVTSVLNKGDVFVFPTLSEGMPNSLLQAMACGLPVVASNVTCIPEIVEEEQNGLLVRPSSASEICNAVHRLLNESSLRRKMRILNRQKILEKHTLEGSWPDIASMLAPNTPSP